MLEEPNINRFIGPLKSPSFGQFRQNPTTKLSAADEAEKDNKLWESTNPELFRVDKSYKGPVITLPIRTSHVEAMIEHFKQNKVSHGKNMVNSGIVQILPPRYLLTILHEARKVLKGMPTLTHLSTNMSGQVTICGDLHGKFDDLCIILHKV